MSRENNGLLSYNDNIYIISNNIANASTIGYKSSKPVFFDMFSHSFYSTNNIGCGVRIANIIQNFSNGTLIATNRDLDLGISKEGFFRIVDTQGHVYYTRNGQFLIDKNRNIVNMNGMYLTGINQSDLSNSINNISGTEIINLKNAYKLDNKATSEIRLKAILNSHTDIVSQVDNNNSLSKLENYTAHINIYKKNGEEEELAISFKKTEENKWIVNVKSNQSDKNSNQKGINSDFELNFDSKGKLISNAEFTIQSNNSEYENINLNLTETVVQPNTKNSIEEPFQNGYASGELKELNIQPNGEIIGNYSNAQEKVIGQILLSKFISPEKLQPESGNVWSATAESGREQIGIAGDNGFGFLNSKTLETSNVDLNQELINMIIAQRNYQSNVQSFKAEDKMINTLINLR